MAIENITMPQLGESVTEGTISRWLVKPGDRVTKYAPIAEVMTDKVNAEIPSSFTGTIRELLASDGDTLPVGEKICTIETEDSDLASEEAGYTAASIQEAGEEIPRRQGKAEERSGDSRKARYSPAVLKMSQEYDIDLSQVTGSGKEGRITRKDLQKLIDSGNIPKAGESEQQVTKQIEVKAEETFREIKHNINIPSAPGDIEIPVKGIRKAIADKMLRSKHEIPHAWTMVEVDVTALVQYRDSLKDQFKQREGFSLTYFAFFVKAVAQALKEFPMMNSMWAEDKIVQKKDINISIAVATEDALYVPVIKHADELSIKGIAKNITDLAKKARSGSLTSEDMKDGTFTVNNTGSIGSVQSMGIINYPQAAILQVESIVKRPVVMDGGMIAVRDMVNLCLSLDHRVLDGLICGRFLQRVKEILENISNENTPIY